MDGTLSLYEQESYSFTRYLPNFLLPGPLAYVAAIDSFITASSARMIECYKLVNGLLMALCSTLLYLLLLLLLLWSTLVYDEMVYDEKAREKAVEHRFTVFHFNFSLCVFMCVYMYLHVFTCVYMCLRVFTCVYMYLVVSTLVSTVHLV